MPPKKAKPALVRSHRRDERKEALARLKAYWEKENPDGEWEPEKEPVITPLLKSVEGGIPRVIEALRAHDDDDAAQFLDCWDHLSATDRSYVGIETIAFASAIGSLRLVEVAQTALYLYGQARTKLLLASTLPAVVEKSLKLAKTTKGYADREWMLKAGGIIPVPKGAQIAIQNNVVKEESGPDPTVPVYLDPGDRLKLIHEAVEGQRRLPSPASEPIDIGGRLDHMQAQTVEAIRESDV